MHGLWIDYDTKFEVTPFKGAFCYWIESIEIVIRYETPQVYIAKEYPVGSCNYRQIRKHELTHVKIAERVLDKYMSRVKSAMNSLVIPKPRTPIVVAASTEAKEKTDDLMESVIVPVFHAFQRELASAQAEIDSQSSYKKVHRRCKKW